MIAGLLLAQAGIVPTLWIFAVTLAAGVLGVCFVKELRRIGKPDTWGADAVEWAAAEPSAQLAR